MRGLLRQVNARKRPLDVTDATLPVDRFVDWSSGTGKRLTAAVTHHRREPFSLDVTGQTAFLHDGTTSYTFPAPTGTAVSAAQIFSSVHAECESLSVEPHLRAADEQLRHRNRFPSDDDLGVWRVRGSCDTHLAELLRLEAPEETTCPGVIGRPCSAAEGLYQCLDCCNLRLYCLECLLFRHADLYMHRIQRWCGNFFWDTTLAEVGLIIQLGHPPHEKCTNPRPSSGKKFMIFDIDYVYIVNLNFCDCEKNTTTKDVQLIRHRLYPGTTVDPETCATFRSLEYFQILTFMSKVSAYEYFYTACRMTDNTGTNVPPDRYQLFLTMVRKWRHLKICKRFGIGNRPLGRSSLKEGDLVVHCPCCPRPGVNTESTDDFGLSPQLGLSSLLRYWTQRLFLAIDANFRLQRNNVSSADRDPSLNNGAAYFVEQKRFDEHIKTHIGEIPDELSTCSQHDALKLANRRGGKGTATSGVGAVVCSRHDMKRGSGAVNLKKGEKYVFMDYAVLSTIRMNTPDNLVISYDIACQWSKRFVWRIDIYGDSLRPRQNMRYALYLVPKFHLPGHVPDCRYRWSFNYTPFVGRTEGEAPERNWSRDDLAATSTKEMGPGSRLDTLDDHFGDANWQKVTSMASALLAKLIEAVAQREDKVISFLGLEESLEKTDSIPRWRALVQAWEADPHNKKLINPYAPKLRALSDHTVRLCLAQEDATTKDDRFVHHTVSPTEFIIQALQLEDLQAKVKLEAQRLGPNATPNQRAHQQESENRLGRRIEALREIQGVYMPEATVMRLKADEESSGQQEASYDMELYLPSSLPRLRGDLDRALALLEYRLRVARAEDSLAQLRSHILLRANMYRIKERQIRGQKLSGRANTVLKNVSNRITDDANRYRSHFRALTKLDKFMSDHSWQKTLKPLNDQDIKNLDDSNESEGYRVLSWIWTAAVGDNTDEQEQEALRIEWCKSRARAQRWQEECVFLRVEMRRLLVTLQHDANEWDERVNSSGATNATQIPGFVDGVKAYARRQAAIRRSMLEHAKRLFIKAPVDAPVIVGDSGQELDVTGDLDAVEESNEDQSRDRNVGVGRS